MIPRNPRAVITIDRPGFTDGQSTVTYDSWDAKGLFKSIETELSTDESSQSKIAFFDPKYRLIDSFGDYTEKAVFKVYLGYGHDLGEPLFKGLLANVGRRRGETTFTVYDMAFVMKLEKKTGYQNGKDDLAIISELVKRNGLQFSPPPTSLALKPEPHKAMTQDAQTDWEHMMERAKAAGLHIFVRHDTVFARYPSDFSKAPVMTVPVPTDKTLLDGWDLKYHALISRESKSKSSSHRGRGPAGKRIEGKVETSAKAEVKHLEIKKDVPSPTKTKLDARAQAQRELEREHAFEGHIETIFPESGPRPDALDVVRLVGASKLLSGDYITETATYRFAPGELSMALDVYRDVKE